MSSSGETPSAKPTDIANNAKGTDVIWRIPREVELWVWKRDADDTPVLVSRETIRICDEESERGSMRLTTSMFGEHGGALIFNDDGQPGSLRHKQSSAVGAFFDALGGVPDAVAGSVATAKETAEGLSTLRDLRTERVRAAAARDLEIAKNRLELTGVHATADDYALLLRAQQAVEVQKVQAELALAELRGEVARFQLELARAEARAKLPAS